MKEFVEKLIGRLEEARQECQKLQKTTTDAYGYMKQKQGIDVAKEIVKQLAEEYINCSTNKSTDKTKINYNDLMIVESLPSLYPMQEFEEKTLQRLVECVKNEYNNGWIPCSERLPNMFDVVLAITEDDLFYVAVCNTTFRQWYDDNFEREIEVIAWMPLPAPFKKGE